MFDSLFLIMPFGKHYSQLVVFFVLVCGVLLIIIHNNRKRTIWERDVAERAREAQTQMAALLRTQVEMQGRMQTMAEIFSQRQFELNQSICEQLNGMRTNLGQTLQVQTKSTHKNLTRLQERLAVIDAAQNNIQSLTGQVVQLQAILNNKQTRGAFGQGRMEAIISDALPSSAYVFQTTLSNGKRPDCLNLYA